MGLEPTNHVVMFFDDLHGFGRDMERAGQDQQRSFHIAQFQRVIQLQPFGQRRATSRSP